jgi:tetratricopeptide (TPR) repeat protein
LTRLREAERVIRGSTDQTDELLATAREETLANWQNRDTDIAAYDHLVNTWGAIGSNEPAEQPFPFLARGFRLAELGRLGEAEADFNKAVELAPEDIEILMARAEFYEQIGGVGRAWEEFNTVWNMAVTSDDEKQVRTVERRLALHETVLKEGLRRSPENAALWRVQAVQQFTRQQWTDAVQSLQHGEHWRLESYLASLHCLLGDINSYRDSLEKLDSLFTHGAEPAHSGRVRLILKALRPVKEEQSAEMLRQLKRIEQFNRPVDGLALYRCGRYEEALQALKESLRPQSNWQNDAMTWPLLAMTEWRLGHQHEAQKWLKQTEWWIDLSQSASQIPGACHPPNIHYSRWLYAHVFYREAKALIEGDGGTPLENKQLVSTPETESTEKKESPQPVPDSP